MLRGAALGAARCRDAIVATSSASPSARKATTRRRSTAIAKAKEGDGTDDDGASQAATAPPSVSRRAALALSLATTAASLLAEKRDALAAGTASIADADPFSDGGTVTLLKVRGDGRDLLSLSEAVVLDTNRKVHSANGAPEDFPGFVRVGFDIKVVVPAEDEGEGKSGGGEQEENATTSDDSSSSAAPETTPAAPPSSPSSNPTQRGYQITPEGLIYKDYEVGEGPTPEEGQEVVFDYTAFNESGARIDSSYLKGRPASARIGVGAGGGLIPGFELGLRGMRAGGRRRLIVPPALGPPVGPQTFFSAKQCEVFDVQLRTVKSCRRRQVAMFSDVVCE